MKKILLLMTAVMLAIAITGCGGASTSAAIINTGSATLITRGWHNSDCFNFSTCAVSTTLGAGGDLWAELNYIRLGIGVTAILVPANTTTAPEIVYTSDSITALNGQLYAVKLPNNTYGLISIQSQSEGAFDQVTGPTGQLTFTYKYRADGSRSF
jgi:hypothetical protein